MVGSVPTWKTLHAKKRDRLEFPQAVYRLELSIISPHHNLYTLANIQQNNEVPPAGTSVPLVLPNTIGHDTPCNDFKNP